MALITRVTRLFRSDLHAVLDQIEEPEILLKQAVREMQDSVDQDEQRIKLYQHELKNLSSRAEDVEQSLSQWEQELDACFDSGKDDLARGLIKRKLEGLSLQKLLDKKRTTTANSLSELQARLEENRARLSAMQQKADIMSEHEDSRHGQDDACNHWHINDPCISNDDIEVAFLREKQKRVTS